MGLPEEEKQSATCGLVQVGESGLCPVLAEAAPTGSQTKTTAGPFSLRSRISLTTRRSKRAHHHHHSDGLGTPRQRTWHGATAAGPRASRRGDQHRLDRIEHHRCERALTRVLPIVRVRLDAQLSSPDEHEELLAGDDGTIDDADRQLRGDEATG